MTDNEIINIVTTYSKMEIILLLRIKLFIEKGKKECWASNEYFLDYLKEHDIHSSNSSISRAINKIVKTEGYRIYRKANLRVITINQPTDKEMANPDKVDVQDWTSSITNLGHPYLYRERLRVKDNTPQTPQGGGSASSVSNPRAVKLVEYWESINKPFKKGRDGQIKAAAELLDEHKPEVLFLVVKTLAEGAKAGFSHEYEYCPQIRTLTGLARAGEVDRVMSSIYRKQQGNLAIIS